MLFPKRAGLEGQPPSAYTTLELLEEVLADRDPGSVRCARARLEAQVLRVSAQETLLLFCVKPVIS